MDPHKSDYDRLGVKVILTLPGVTTGGVFERDGKIFDMALAGMTEAALSPVMVGADRVISAGCQAKGIDPESGFNLLFSEEYFPMADVLFTLAEGKF
jgi:roadblock/LC7 domain-containing protein